MGSENVMSMDAELAKEWSTQAADRHRPEDQVDAIGEGLAAIARALLDVAAAIRETGGQ